MNAQMGIRFGLVTCHSYIVTELLTLYFIAGWLFEMSFYSCITPEFNFIKHGGLFMQSASTRVHKVSVAVSKDKDLFC
jgi:hypothetical protein